MTTLLEIEKHYLALQHQLDETKKQLVEKLNYVIYDLSQAIYDNNSSHSTHQQFLSLRRWRFDFHTVEREEKLGLTLNFAGLGVCHFLILSKQDIPSLVSTLDDYQINSTLKEHILDFCNSTVLNTTFSTFIEEKIKRYRHSFECHFGTKTSYDSDLSFYDKEQFSDQFKLLFGEQFFISHEKDLLDESVLKNNSYEKKITLKI
jgi:hypothetical protein